MRFVDKKRYVLPYALPSKVGSALSSLDLFFIAADMRYQVKLEVHCYAAQLLWFRLPTYGVLLHSYTFVNICFKLPCFSI